MVSSHELVVGQIYFIVQYDDAELTRPIISSGRYIGKTYKDSEEREHAFQLLGFSDDHLFLRERDLDIAFDLSGLLEEIKAAH